jgi:thiamine biosynthesis lipoprotein
MTESFRAMGCVVVVSGGDPHRARRLFYDDDRLFSRFAPSSELNRVNAADGPVLVSPRFARVLRAALAAARQTGGLVDPTLLDALEAAGYDRDFDELMPDSRPPAPGATGRAASVRLAGQLVTRPADVRLDLNGVVKSMAVDEALTATGADWVSAGGDVATTRPLEVALPGGGAVRLEKGALATSGSAVRRWIRAGSVQHHLIDPRTGAPAESPWEQVTACGATCLMADVAAKAAFLMGDDGPAWLDARDMPGRFIRTDHKVIVNTTWERACT